MVPYLHPKDIMVSKIQEHKLWCCAVIFVPISQPWQAFHITSFSVTIVNLNLTLSTGTQFSQSSLNYLNNSWLILVY